jgi:signal transduction histidine kinase
MYSLISKILRAGATLLSAFCLISLVLPTHVAAKDLVSARSYWEDAQGQSTFDDAQTQSYTSYDGILAKGYSDSVFWLRLRVEPVAAAQASEKLVLRVRPSFLDQVVLFDPADTTRTGPVNAGDMTAWAESEYQSLNHGFLIASLPQARDVYLRVSSTSTLMIHVEVLTQLDASRLDHTQELIYSVGTGLIVMFLAWVFVSWLNDRDHVNRAFVIKQLASILYTVGYFGYFRVFFGESVSPTGINLLFNIVVIAATGLAFWYETHFLRDYELPAWLMRVVRSFYVSAFVAMALLFSGYTRLALQFNMVVIGVGSAFLLIAVLVFLRNPPNKQTAGVPFRFNRSTVTVYYLSLTFALWVAVWPSLGFDVATEYSLHNLVLNGFFSGLLMTILLQVRVRRFELSRREVSNALYLSQQQVAFERQRRDEQTHFLHMLMHELKTPLAVIDMALHTHTDPEKSAAYASRAVVDMKAILERCIDADQIEEGALEAKVERVDVVRLLNELIFSQNIQAERLSLQMPEVPEVLTDRQYLRIILGNLLDNALRYSDGRTPVDIQVVPSDGPDGAPGVAVTFSNRPGLAAWPEPSKVFQKYYRSTGAQSQSGTGLGLFLVSSLANRIGAYCRYAPDEKRVRFVLWLPI